MFAWDGCKARLRHAVRPAAVALAGTALLATAAMAAPASPARVDRPPAQPAARGNVHVEATEPIRAIAIAEDERHWSDAGLGAYLRDRDPEVRARAALACGRLQDSSAVPALLPLLADSSMGVRREAVFALGQIGQRASRPVVAPLALAPDPELRQLAIEALGKLGDRLATPVVVHALDDPVVPVRAAAAVALWRLADSTATPALIAHDNDPEAGVRWRVLWAMEKIAAPDALVLRAALRLDDPDVLVRAHAARTIGREKSPRGTVYLLNALTDANESVVVNAIRGLQLIGDTTCAVCGPSLLRSLAHPHPYVRVTAATALGERFAWVSGDSLLRRRIVDSLTVHLADPDAATRGAAAKALVARRGVEVLPLVQPLLADPSVYVRVAVLESFRTLPPGGMPFDLLRARLAPPAALFERTTAAEVLGDRRDPGAETLLRAGLADTSVLFVSSCASGLAALGDTASVAALVQLYGRRVGDHEPDARMSILDALRTLGRVHVADSLEHGAPARHPSPAVHDAEFFRIPAERGAVIHTSKGDIEWAFFGREAPQTVRNFVRLAKRGYFDGAFVHRVVPDFVIQDGDPTGTGSGGPGYTIRCEYNRLHYDAGMVGMALSGKDTGGSQWFITHSPQLHLDGRYTIFARVVRGQDVAGRIVQGDEIRSVEILP